MTSCPTSKHKINTCNEYLDPLRLGQLQLMNERVRVLLCSSPAALAPHGELAKKQVLLTIKSSKSDSGSFAAESLSKNATLFFGKLSSAVWSLKTWVLADASSQHCKTNSLRNKDKLAETFLPSSWPNRTHTKEFIPSVCYFITCHAPLQVPQPTPLSPEVTALGER